MNEYPIRTPQTILDWAAIREDFRGRLELLKMETLSILYGLSSTVGFRDDNFTAEVEDHLSKSADPVRVRFDFAYQLTSGFWETYELWDFHLVQPPESGKASDFVDGFHDKVLNWLVDGLTLYSNESDIMDMAYFTVSRIGAFDTFLEEEDIAILEAAAQKEISLENSEGGRKLIEHLYEVFGKQVKGNQKDEDPLSSDFPRDPKKLM